MILCDANIWLALALSRHVHHRAAREWLESVGDAGAILFCRATQHALLRLLTNASVLSPYGNRALTNKQAWAVYEAFSDDDRIAIRTDEPPDLQSVWKRLAAGDTSSPKLWMDAYLAAYALTGGLRLVTTDSAFRQFAGLNALIVR